MSNWTDWIEISHAKSRRGPLNDFGIYQVGVADSNEQAIPINRLVGIDLLGLLYVGRSGYRYQKTERTIANSIREFVQQTHSGGITYSRAKKVLQKSEQYSGHRLQVRAMFLPDEEIELAEANMLYDYFAVHAELPPCNSALPKVKRITDGG